MRKFSLVVVLSMFALTGCSSSSSPQKNIHSSDWESGYKYATESWSQPGFRTLMGVQPTNTSICNYIAMSAITGFNPLNGFKNQKERDFYNGCQQYFVEAGFDAQTQSDDSQSKVITPAPSQPSTDPKSQMPSYWKPTVKNMILCARDYSTCEGGDHEVSSGNTFGKNAAKIAEQLVELGFCSDINRYDETSDENISQCYIDDQGNSLQVITSDENIQMLLAYQLHYQRKMLLKDGLIVIVASTDRPELIDQIGAEIGGQVIALG